MREDEVLRQVTTPLSAPAFPRGPYRFTDREYLNITYRTDPAALRALVPEPLEVPEPLVRFEVMRLPDVTGLGDYTESGQVALVTHDGEPGEFTLGMYVDSLPAIASGREVGAYPKKLGKPRLFVDSDTLVGSLGYGSIQVALATMGYKHRELDEAAARAELTAPTYMLKIVPGYDGRPRICELARSRISDLTIKGAWTGPARLHLVPHALAPLADLPVLEIVSASHLLTDLTLGRLSAVHDYLDGDHA
ncbi:acetoacetate decarboxylase [Amycolatopsis sp. OK19-0408]|uniref:Acetoacetate decarboxylase n=1 Tax=Amycolatopsis iheyensis TaxID=2945988 RepID=A0A9X2SPD4_9PSEU|nr:acetoacetate decarboxylase [Amycolatopsis iheyensis]MCR6487435.1 acetoacetate decarboxylase [Amycolatopsis iheyensis]